MKESRKKCIRVLNSLLINKHLHESDYFDLLSYVVGRDNETDDSCGPIKWYTVNPHDEITTVHSND